MEQLFSFIIKAYYFDFIQREASGMSSVPPEKEKEEETDIYN